VKVWVVALHECPPKAVFSTKDAADRFISKLYLPDMYRAWELTIDVEPDEIVLGDSDE